MVDLFIKSILSLGILHLFYLLLLSRLKTFNFNRFYMLGSLVFSLTIPFVSIQVDNAVLPIVQSTGSLSISNTIEYSAEFIANKEIEHNTIFSLLPFLYAAISLILLIRFTVNLFSIIQTVINNKKIRKEGYSIVLLCSQIIPYSFFRYVLVNRDQYQNNEIDEALIQHEVTHCKQWHSFDILSVELLKVLFWINPFIWFMKKNVQLNHEFMADNKVLINHDLRNYRNLLVNLVLNHNPGILISNFNFSLTKQRLKMMTKPFSKKQTAVSILATSIFVFFLGLTLAFSSKDFEYKLTIDGKGGNYGKIALRHSDFGMMHITTTKKTITVEKFEISLARGNRAVFYDKNIQGNQFDLKNYTENAREGDRIVIEIKELSDKSIELTQNDSIITIKIEFEN